MKATGWVVVGAFMLTAAAAGCRGDRTDYDDAYDSPAGATGDATRDSAAATASDSELVPVPGTPHNVRPGVTGERNPDGTVSTPDSPHNIRPGGTDRDSGERGTAR